MRAAAKRSRVEPAVLARAVRTPVGLRLPDSLTDAEWVDIGAALACVDSAASWWLGDWWVAGEVRHGARKALCERADWRGPAYQTLANCAYVARRFPSQSSRHRELSFSHHAEVASLNALDAAALLAWAVAHKSSVAALRAERWERHHAAIEEEEARPLMVPVRTAAVAPRLLLEIMPAPSPTWTEPPGGATAGVVPFRAGNAADADAIRRMEREAHAILATAAISERLRARLARIGSFLLTD